MTCCCKYHNANRAADLIALLYSRLATLCTAFNVSVSSFVSDSSIVPLFIIGQAQTSTNIAAINTSTSVLTLLLRPVEFANPGILDPSGPGLAYSQSGIGFYKLFGLYNDLSLREGLYFSTSEFTPSAVQAPDRKSRIGTMRSSTKVWDDNLIIADELAVDDSDEGWSELLPSASRLPNAVRKTTEPGQEDQWTVNLEWLYDELESRLNITSTSEASELHNAKSFEDYLEHLDATIRDVNVKGGQGLESL